MNIYLLSIISTILFLAIFFTVARNVFAKSKPSIKLGLENNKFVTNSKKPNWVSTFAKSNSHKVEPLNFAVNIKNIQEIKTEIEKLMLSLTRTVLIKNQDEYLHFTTRTALWGFVDDVEFLIDKKNKLIHFRSSSRIGFSDLGLNRRRYKKIKQKWEETKKVE